jgi:16S rRNA (guanine966-N2)-methyltransferase
VREALGSLLEARGALQDAHVLDLFAGTGALGIEALSRGASALVSVEQDARALRGIEQNFSALGIEAEARALRLDLLKAPARAARTLAGLPAAPFRLVLADPPYRELAKLGPLLDALASGAASVPETLFVVEHARDSEPPASAVLAPVASYSYGDSALTLLARAI